ncbi:thioredoxin-disulfide reductase [Chloroflexota bacterium]
MPKSKGDKEYDVVIIGGGPAGLAAGLYTSRARLSSLLIEKIAAGGSIVNAGWVENYPGFPQGISGIDLADTMKEQATKYGLEILLAEVTGLELRGESKVVKSNDGNIVAKAVIIAGGSERNKLGVPGEDEYTGRGVAYCAVCDAAFFRDKPVAVVGGGNAAINEALHLSRFASKVVVIHRRQELRATRIVQEKVFAEPKIEFLWNTVVEAIEGETVVGRLRLHNVSTGEKSTLDISGIFVATGSRPNTDYLQGILSLDTTGAIIADENMETEIPGILVAGDIRSGSIRQVVAAAGDGATAAIYAEKFITE